MKKRKKQQLFALGNAHGLPVITRKKTKPFANIKVAEGNKK